MLFVRRFSHATCARKKRPRVKAQAEAPPVPLTTQRQDAELEAEQRRGREMLAKYAQRNEAAAAARDRISAAEKAKESR